MFQSFFVNFATSNERYNMYSSVLMFMYMLSIITMCSIISESTAQAVFLDVGPGREYNPSYLNPSIYETI